MGVRFDGWTGRVVRVSLNSRGVDWCIPCGICG